MEGIELTQEIAEQVGLTDDEFNILYLHKESDASFSWLGKAHGMTKQGAHYLYQRALKKLDEYGYEFVTEERLTRRKGYV